MLLLVNHCHNKKLGHAGPSRFQQDSLSNRYDFLSGKNSSLSKEMYLIIRALLRLDLEVGSQFTKRKSN